MHIHNLIELPMWLKITLPLGLGVLQSIAVTLSYHRAGTHTALKLNPILEMSLTLFLGFVTGVRKTLWTITHAIHHKDPDGKNDITSPKNPIAFRLLGRKKTISGPITGFLAYFFLYKNINFFYKIVRHEKIPDQVEKALKKENWFYRTFLHTYVGMGPIIFFFVCLFLFGWYGALLFLIQFLWLPFFSGYVVNGLGHSKETENTKSPYDFSRNLMFQKFSFFSRPLSFMLSILTAGESLHGGHHAHQTSAQLSDERGEFDFGFFVIKILKRFKLLHNIKIYDKTTAKMVYIDR